MIKPIFKQFLIWLQNWLKKLTKFLQKYFQFRILKFTKKIVLISKPLTITFPKSIKTTPKPTPFTHHQKTTTKPKPHPPKVWRHLRTHQTVKAKVPRRPVISMPADAGGGDCAAQAYRGACVTLTLVGDPTFAFSRWLVAQGLSKAWRVVFAGFVWFFRGMAGFWGSGSVWCLVKKFVWFLCWMLGIECVEVEIFWGRWNSLNAGFDGVCAVFVRLKSGMLRGCWNFNGLLCL